MPYLFSHMPPPPTLHWNVAPFFLHTFQDRATVGNLLTQSSQLTMPRIEIDPTWVICPSFKDPEWEFLWESMVNAHQGQPLLTLDRAAQQLKGAWACENQRKVDPWNTQLQQDQVYFQSSSTPCSHPLATTLQTFLFFFPLWATRQSSLHWVLHFHRTSDPSFLFVLSSLITIHSCYHSQITSDCLVPFSYPLSVWWPLSCTIHWPTKRCYCRLGLCPLALVALPARSHPAVYKMYQYSTWTLSLSFRAIRTSKLKTQELHKSFDFPVSLLSAAA